MEAPSLHCGGQGQLAVSPKPSTSCLPAAGPERHCAPSLAHQPWRTSQKQSACRDDGVLAPHLTLASTWSRSSGVGAGLRNMGDTCYVNAALQCLTYTPPLADYMLSREHAASCGQQGYCVLCAMQDHITRALSHPGDVMEPSHALARGLHRHQQEDAHEFLMSTLDAVQKACLRSHRHLRGLSEDTTLIRRIFGGYWRSRIQCCHCQGVSDTFDPYLDITLDIQAAQSVNQALEQLVTAEELDGENSYQCRICQRKMPASKTLTLHTCPEALVLVLKRFSDLSGDKNAKQVRYPASLDVSRCLSRQDGGPAAYRLYAVLVHVGWTCHTGHYLSYVKAGNGKWYRMDDAEVSACDVTCVLSQQAYALFYIHQSELVRGSGGVARGGASGGHGMEAADEGPRPGVPEGDAKVNVVAADEEQLGGPASRQMTLEEWKILQARDRLKPQFNIRVVESALPSNAVVIHKPKLRSGVAKDHGEQEGRRLKDPARDIPARVAIHCGNDVFPRRDVRGSKKKRKKRGKGTWSLDGFQ
ncbi:ubiquitin carboxyl-terminal hydrolase 17-like protein 6 [Loxodonta africana]|uniref:ubiquitin carboxyl-terminal hydrolase 17-like protein 6 n=1 Tax=Loxodonta africana TaxID=9785 RepID=UPI0030D5F435